MEFIQGLMAELISNARAGFSFLFVINIFLLIFASPIVSLIAPGQDNKARIRIFRSLNLLVLIFYVLDFALRRAGFDSHYFGNLGVSLMVIYGGVFLYSLMGTISRQRFGKTRVLDNQTVHLESYNSRLVSLVLLGLIAITVIYGLIKIWGADSLLETTGIFGIFIAFLAFTSSIWAPDIVSGLIILNSDILVDGDVVVVDGHPNEYIIARVTLIYVVLYDVRNNHRTLLRNTQFIQSRIDNLSRIASSDGIRQGFKYNIGYPEMPEDRPGREAALAEFQEQIDTVFTSAFDACCADEHVLVNENKPFEWAMTNAGDYALEYTLWVYLERIPNTKVTKTIRKYLMGTLYKINEAVYAASVVEGVDLSTPDLVNVGVNQTKK
jgi:hypothetical protein